MAGEHERSDGLAATVQQGVRGLQTGADEVAGREAAFEATRLRGDGRGEAGREAAFEATRLRSDGRGVAGREAAFEATRLRSDGRGEADREAAFEATRLRSAVRGVESAGVGESAALRVIHEAGRIGRFVVLRELGRGAMGVVFAAYDEELDRKVAIKLLHAGHEDEASYGRGLLLREAQAMARLAHPNVVAVHEVGVLEGAVFVAMEYVAGVDLERWLAGAQRPWREVVAVLRQAGLGLVAAHREGMVHRDFKPSNVLVGEDLRVKVADFGLAARRGGTRDGAVGDPQFVAAATMTATLSGEGMLVGTPVYMAPELLRGGSATAHSDQYAYCVALYEALYGARPFAGATLAALTEAVERRALPGAPPRAEVPGWLHAAVVRGLAKAPEGRHATLAALVELLARDPEAEAAQRRRRALQIAGAIAATAAIVALVVFGVWAVRGYVRAREADGRLAALRGQLAELRGRGDEAESRRLLAAFVDQPENRGVLGRAYLEYATAQTEPAAAVDAYGSAYVAAGTPAEGHAALRGLIAGLQTQGRVTEAAAALGVLEAEAPAEARSPELQAVRLSAALARRDLAGARTALAAADEGGWSAVLEDLSHTTDTQLTPVEHPRWNIEVFDFDGDGVDEVVSFTGGAELRVHRADAVLTPARVVRLGAVDGAKPVAAVAAGEPLVLSHVATEREGVYQLRLGVVDADGGVRTVDEWEDSRAYRGWTVDLDADGRREVYVGTGAYSRELWRIDREADGTWSRRVAHPPTEATGSDIDDVAAMDLDGDERPELVVSAGPWMAYDLRVLRPAADRGLELRARRSFGCIRQIQEVRAGGRSLVAFHKIDGMIAPGRFPPDRPLGEPTGLYVAELRGGAIEVPWFLPERPEGRPRQFIAWMWAGDLDGDGADELVVQGDEWELLLIRVRAGQPLRPLALAGLQVQLVRDLDGDGRAEIVVRTQEDPTRTLVLGAGDGRLARRAGAEIDPRPLPADIEDPAIRVAWTHAEQLVAIGLPRRTADDLGAIARLSGQVAPDMLFRTGELYAAVGEDAKAADNFVAAATRPDIAGRALAGAVAARKRLGEFAAAAELTRQRIAVIAADERAEAEAELATLAAVTAARPETRLTFTRPLDERWRVHDPVAVQRALGRGALSVWSSPTPVLAELPLVWDGGPAALEVELEVERVEWGARLQVEVAAGERRWLQMEVGGFGVTDEPETRVSLGLVSNPRWDEMPAPTSVVRVRVEVVPALATEILEVELGQRRERRVQPTSARERETAPTPGPMQLQLKSQSVVPGYVMHAWIREIRLTGFTPAGPAVDDEAARRLSEQDAGGALAVLTGDARRVWRIDALLGLRRIDAAAAEIEALLASTSVPAMVRESGAEHREYLTLYQRLRRGDEVAWSAAHDAFGPRLVDLVIAPGGELRPRQSDVEAALTWLPATWSKELPADGEALRLRVTTLYARGAAHRMAGQLAAARAYLDAGLEQVGARPFDGQVVLSGELLEERLWLAIDMGDRADAMRWLRALLRVSWTPYMSLEVLRSRPGLYPLIGAEEWARIEEEFRPERLEPSPRE